MGRRPDPEGARWRKSSYSGNTGGECVECVPLGPACWRTFSYSRDNGGDNSGDCSEGDPLDAHVLLRDSKHPDGGTVTVSTTAFGTFITTMATATV